MQHSRPVARQLLADSNKADGGTSAVTARRSARSAAVRRKYFYGMSAHATVGR
jgi:hypothetical protein